MKRDSASNQVQLYLEAGGVASLADTTLTIHAEEIQDLALDIADLRVRLRLICWFGRLLDVMYARLNDRLVRPALVGRRDIPDVVVALGTAWAWLYWPGGHTAISTADVERMLAILGVDLPIQYWRQYCHREAEKVGMELGREFLE